MNTSPRCNGSKNRALRHRVRYRIDGAAIGDATFVERRASIRISYTTATIPANASTLEWNDSHPALGKKF